jgi:hypothetical protein
MNFETRVALSPENAELLRQVRELMNAEVGVKLTLPQVIYRLCLAYLKGKVN